MRFTFIEKALIVGIFFVILLFIFPKNLIIANVSDLFTVTAIVFGILAGFFIAAALSNYFRLQTLLSEETSYLVHLYNVCKILEPNLKKEITSAIDKYLIAAFDFELVDYVDKTWKEFNNILKVTDKIKPRDSDIYGSLLEIRGNLLRVRQEITLTARKIMGTDDWITLIILAAITIFLLYVIRTPTIVSSIFTVILSSSICLVLFLLYEIDSNIFAEEKLAFEMFQRVFEEIGELPYYPLISIKSGRVKPKGKCRVGIYINYPKSLEKRIEVREF
jgi:hypothetical protein